MEEERETRHDVSYSKYREQLQKCYVVSISMHPTSSINIDSHVSLVVMG